MLTSVGSTTSTSWSYLNDSTQNPTQDPATSQNPGGQTNQSDQTNPNQQSKPVNTASAVASLRKIEQSIAKKLKTAEQQASKGLPGAQAIAEMLTSQVVSLQAEIDNVSGLNSMRTQSHSVTSLQSSSQSLRIQNQVQKTQQAKQAQQVQQGKSITDTGDSSTSPDPSAKPFRFDLTGTLIDETA